MIATGTVTMASGETYRVSAGGSTSAPMRRLTCAVKKSADAQSFSLPGVGDAVLCWFPGNSYCDGVIIGVLEG